MTSPSDPTAVLSRDSFFGAAPAPLVEDVPAPWGGGVVRVRQITAGERDKFESGVYGKEGPTIRVALLLTCCVDAAGSPLFLPDDGPRLAALPANVVEPIVEAASRLNAIRPRDLDDLEKKSEAAPSEPSSSDSP